MALSDLVANLRTDLGDAAGDLFPEATLTRCLQKSVFRLARDLGVEWALVNGEIQPEPVGENRELLLLLARIHACQVMRTATAGAFSFTSGDKSVDKTKQASHWAQLEADLRTQYKARLAEINPATTLAEDDYFVNPGDIGPVIYEQGSRRQCHSDQWRKGTVRRRRKAGGGQVPFF